MKKKKGMMSLIFEAGAMPRLNRLWFRFVVHDTLSTYGANFDFGISLLSSLKCLWVSINCRGSMVWEVEAAKATITNAAALLPNCPRHEIHIFGEEEMVEDEEHKEDGGTADQPDGAPTRQSKILKVFGISFSSFEVVFQAQLAAPVFILFTYVVGLGYD